MLNSILQQNCNLILASKSSIRRKILQDSGLDFEVAEPTYDEDNNKLSLNLKPDKLALYLAKQKALSISNIKPNHYIIGSDQVCEFLGKEIFKSNNKEEALLQLCEFNGKSHFQNNAVVIAENNKIIFSNITKAKLTMRQLTKSEINSYISYDKSWGCAGSYKYESMGKHLFSEVIGDYYGILGLSIQPLLSFLHKEELIKII